MREERGGLLKGGDDEFQEEWFGHEEGEESLHVGGLRCGWDAARSATRSSTTTASPAR